MKKKEIYNQIPLNNNNSLPNGYNFISFKRKLPDKADNIIGTKNVSSKKQALKKRINNQIDLFFDKCSKEDITNIDEEEIEKRIKEVLQYYITEQKYFKNSLSTIKLNHIWNFNFNSKDSLNENIFLPNNFLNQPSFQILNQSSINLNEQSNMPTTIGINGMLLNNILKNQLSQNINPPPIINKKKVNERKQENKNILNDWNHYSFNCLTKPVNLNLEIHKGQKEATIDIELENDGNVQWPENETFLFNTTRNKIEIPKVKLEPLNPTKKTLVKILLKNTDKLKPGKYNNCLVFEVKKDIFGQGIFIYTKVLDN